LLDCQGKSFLENFTPIADFRMKVGKPGEKSKNNISGRS
jgi:hypothetical protein